MTTRRDVEDTMDDALWELRKSYEKEFESTWADLTMDEIVHNFLVYAAEMTRK